MPTTQEFRAAISERLEAAQRRGEPFLDIEAGRLHEDLGGYPPRQGRGHQMPMCCDAMRQEMRPDDKVIEEPPSGKGARLKVRYFLHEPVSRFATAPTDPQAKHSVGALVQHDTARRALPIIAKEAMTGGQLSYAALASALGRSRKDARAVAQVCDLLDSAAILARRPLMALWTVRTASGEINPQAWTKDTVPGLRDELIKQAKTHVFSETDEAAIRYALSRLVGLGNGRAWKHVLQVDPQEAILARLRGRDLRQADSLNDLGTDDPPLIFSGGRSYARDPEVRAAVMRRAAGVCEYCGKRGFRQPGGHLYLECHHIIALAKDGKDRLTNVIALFPDHHREAHFGERSLDLEKQMMLIVREKEEKMIVRESKSNLKT